MSTTIRPFLRPAPAVPAREPAPLPWVEVNPGTPYFRTEDGSPWTPIGQNDAVTWPELAGAFRRRDLPAVDAYLETLAAHGVTCLRLMLEYCHGEHRYLERPVGRFQPNMVRLWDDLFAMCEARGLRILLTPYDTFWMWLRWPHHPYHRRHGGPCDRRSRWLLCPETREAIKGRLAFATERWGGSGALFAWDLWNEIHPAHAGDSAEVFHEFVEEVGTFLRETELRLHGRAHPQTVSVFCPVLPKDGRIGECVFRHPALDFASAHFYESGTIDHPRDTVAPAVSAGELTRRFLAEIRDNRPFLDSEHGPIHAFKDRRVTLPEPFDDEYFRHIQWAHFASGGAGGGMRWPNRHPHALTRGMRAAQRALTRFLPLVDWGRFRRRNLNHELGAPASLAAFGCGDRDQAVVWLLRRGPLTRDGRLCRETRAEGVHVEVPGLDAGCYRVTAWDTREGSALGEHEVRHPVPGPMCLPVPPFAGDVALALRRTGPAFGSTAR